MDKIIFRTKKNKLFFFVLLILLVLSIFVYADDKLYVDNEKAEIKVNWSEDIQKPFAILEGDSIGRKTDYDCGVIVDGLNCMQNSTFKNIYVYTVDEDLKDGNYNFTIWASDINGNPMNDFVGKEFVIDTIPPSPSNISYYVSGMSESGKIIEIYLDFHDNEVFEKLPEIYINGDKIEMFPPTFIDNATNSYRYYYIADIKSDFEFFDINATDKAGNTDFSSHYLGLSAPSPPITNPYDGAVISDNMKTFTFFFDERIPSSQMNIYYDDILISDSQNFNTSKFSILRDMFYYYNLQENYDDPTHTLTIEAWDESGNKLGPYDINFIVDPEAPNMPNIRFDDVLGSSNEELSIISNNDPTISFEFLEDVNLESVTLISADKNFIRVSGSNIINTSNRDFFIDLESLNIELPEGLNSIMFDACKKDDLNHCIKNVTSSIIVNVGPPKITFHNPLDPNGGRAKDEILRIETSERAICKQKNRHVEGVDSKYFFVDENNFSNDRYYYFSNDVDYVYNHETKIGITAQVPGSLPIIFNYSIVCRDLFYQYTNITYADFSLDKNQPVIESITPLETISYYFFLNVTTNEDTTCRYKFVDDKLKIPSEDSEEYESFYNSMIRLVDDTDGSDPYRINHVALLDYRENKGSILEDGKYKIYVDCKDEAGNYARNNQFEKDKFGYIKFTKYNDLFVNTNSGLVLSNISLDGVINNGFGLLSFNTNRNARCSFKFANATTITPFDSQLPELHGMDTGVTNGYYHEVYLAGNDVYAESRSWDYMLPQYPDNIFPEGSYEYEVICSTEGTIDILYDTNYNIVYLDGTDDFFENYYQYSKEHSFTIDNTPPKGLNVSIKESTFAPEGYIFETDRVRYQIKTSKDSSDVDYFLIAIDTSNSLSNKQPDTMAWKNISGTSGTLLELELKDKMSYYLHVKGVDKAGNIQDIADVSDAFTVDTNLKPTCDDEKKNQDETDVDCGGKNCGACSLSKECEKNSDCKSEFCALNLTLELNVCQEFVDYCANGIKDLDETDVDCGGVCDQKCDVGFQCLEDSDCTDLSFCGESLTCESSCGNDVCDIKYGEDDFSCAKDCSIKTDTEILSPRDECLDNGKYWYDGSCHVYPQEDNSIDGNSGFEFIDILTIIIVVLCLGGVGGYLYYMKKKNAYSSEKIKPNENIDFKEEKKVVPTPVVKAKVEKKKEVSRKPYSRKRDLSILDSFEGKNKNVNDQDGDDPKDKSKENAMVEEKGKTDNKKSKPKSAKKQTIKKSSKDGLGLDDLLSDDMDELDKLGSDNEADLLDKLASKDNSNDDLDKLSDMSDDFDELSKLVGDDNAQDIQKVTDIKTTKKQDNEAVLFDTLAAVKTDDLEQNRNIFEKVLTYLVKSGKLKKQELSKMLLDLSNKGLIKKEDMMDVLYNIENNIK